MRKKKSEGSLEPKKCGSCNDGWTSVSEKTTDDYGRPVYTKVIKKCVVCDGTGSGTRGKL